MQWGEGCSGLLSVFTNIIFKRKKILLRSVDFGSIQSMNCLLNDDAEEVIGTRSSSFLLLPIVF